MKEKLVMGIKSVLFHSRVLHVVADDIINYVFYRDFLRHRDKIKSFHNKHKGERCFIVATGPSLNKTNLSLLKDEVVFGVNTLYKGLDRFGIDCDYYAISDRWSWIRHSKSVLGLGCVVFCCYAAARNYLRNKSMYNREPYLIRGRGSIILSKGFPDDVSSFVYADGYTVTIICLQIAFYMGFSEVYLVGCDCSYGANGHFDGQPPGYRNEKERSSHWSVVFEAYKICKKVFEENGRKIYNSTVGGDLEAFERKNLEEIVKK